MTTNKTIGGGGFHHVAMRVKDFGRSHRFYTQALGFKETYAWRRGEIRAAMLDTGDGNYLEIYSGAGDRAEQESLPLLHFALRTSDCDAATEAARRGGAEITVEPKDVDIPTEPGPYRIRLSFCKGPDGELIEFFQEK